MAAVAVRNVSKTFDRVRWVLRNVTMAVEPGEIAVVMGRSGSGKSTLLNLVAALETPTQGSIVVDGSDLATADEATRSDLRLRRIGTVFQRFLLIPELTVSENIRLPMKLARRRDVRERTKELLSFFGLLPKADAFPATLSGGELQRTAIARALGNEPAVLLADEPTANLDDANAENALSALREVADTYRTAVLVASHDSMVRDLGDVVYEISGGRIDSGGLRRPALPKAPR